MRLSLAKLDVLKDEGQGFGFCLEMLLSVPARALSSCSCSWTELFASGKLISLFFDSSEGVLCHTIRKLFMQIQAILRMVHLLKYK